MRSIINVEPERMEIIFHPLFPFSAHTTDREVWRNEGMQFGTIYTTASLY